MPKAVLSIKFGSASMADNGKHRTLLPGAMKAKDTTKDTTRAKTKRFEEACKEIMKRDNAALAQFKLQGRNRDPAVLLKRPFRAVARKYLYFELSGGPNFSYIFSWKQVTDACKRADIYVTDVVEKYY